MTQISELFNACKTIMLPENFNSDCYAVFTKEEFEEAEESLSVDGKFFKHRLYFHKKLNDNPKTLSIVVLSPMTSTHINHDYERFEEFAKDEYGAIEVYSIFTLRTTDPIDAILSDTLLDITRIDFGKNDVALAYGDELQRTEKHSNLSDEELKKINTVRQIKINGLTNFLRQKPRKVVFL